MLTNSVTLADYNSADSHLTQTITCPSCTNQGNGYIGVWTATPGTHDVTASPNFVDVYRNLALWDTKYLGNAAATQWTSSLGVLASGTLVSDSHAGYYNGLTINFRCIASAGCDTSASNSEPNVGVSWRLYWEFASFKDIENATASGTIYTDGAIGCTSGCTAIQAITAWVKKGFIPQSPALWKAGHDGADIGAVDTPMVNHIPPPVMMP